MIRALVMTTQSRAGFWVKCPAGIYGQVVDDQGRWIQVQWEDGPLTWSQGDLMEWL